MEPRSEQKQAQILADAIRPDVGDFTEAGARDLLRIGFSEIEKARISELGSKANAGIITESETEELDCFLNAARAIELVKAKARVSLKSAA
jgi:hypothetical protein